ncbi:MAG TPA: hypothetical protein VD993_07645 [Chitinophagaceae bacterium]|nr:hypothetical protein [Chitinophagaceae bacterium]
MRSLIICLLLFSSLAATPQGSYRSAPEEPVVFGYTNDVIYGSAGNKIYTRAHTAVFWNYQFTLPFDVREGKLALADSTRIVYNPGNDSLLYFEISSRQVTLRSKRAMFEAFNNNPVVKIIIEKGSAGCFHYDLGQVSFEENNGDFELEHTDFNKRGRGTRLPAGTDYISGTLVKRFLQQMPVIYEKKASLQDLGITAADMQRVKAGVLKAKERAAKGNDKDYSIPLFMEENIDFNKLTSLIDSLPFADRATVHESLVASRLFSTTSYWVKFVFINDKDEKLSVSCTYSGDNTFYFPWRVTIDGFTFYNTSIEITAFMKTAYPGLLDKMNVTWDKQMVLYWMLGELYAKH